MDKQQTEPSEEKEETREEANPPMSLSPNEKDLLKLIQTSNEHRTVLTKFTYEVDIRS